MITNASVDDNFEILSNRLKELAEELTDKLRPEDENVLIEKGQLLSDPTLSGQNRFFMLTDGHVAASFGKSELFYYEQGELVGIECAAGIGSVTASLEFAVRANVYNRDKCFKKIRKDKKLFAIFTEYLSTQGVMFQQMLAATISSIVRPNFEMRTFEPGKDIICQGDTDKDVYSMISGLAYVLVDEKKVGEIGENEVFGEMSRLTGAPRSATVRAEKLCEVMVFGGDDFTVLAETNPAALREIAKNLSERLANANKEAVNTEK